MDTGLVTNEDPDRWFAVAGNGEASVELDVTAPDHEPDAEARWRAKALCEGGNFNKDVEDLFARAIAIGRAGGSVEAFLREQLGRRA